MDELPCAPIQEGIEATSQNIGPQPPINFQDPTIFNPEEDDQEFMINIGGLVASDSRSESRVTTLQTVQPVATAADPWGPAGDPGLVTIFENWGPQCTELHVPSQIQPIVNVTSDGDTAMTDHAEVSCENGSSNIMLKPELGGQNTFGVLLNDKDDKAAGLEPEMRSLQEDENDQSSYEEDDLTELPIAPTVAIAMTDEGYQSMTKQENLDTGEVDAVSDRDSVRTDNRDSRLPQNVKEQLSIYFAQEILDNIQLTGDEVAGAIDDICSALPDLLREFSTLVARQARPGIEERACIFVRHQRK
jgi:hypothetical protein